MSKEQWSILGAFVAGCVITNLLRENFFTTYGILNDYFLNQYSYHVIDGNHLFCHILFERGKAAVTIFLFGRVMTGKMFDLAIKCLLALTIGFLLSVAIINLGIRGIVICVCALFPQWIFYTITLLCYAICRKDVASEWKDNSTRDDIMKYFLRGAIILLSMLLGIYTESYVNPIFLKYVLKFF